MDLRPAQVNLFNKWWHNELLKQVEPHKAGKIEKKLLEQYPELSPMITAWVEYREECLNHHFEKEKMANETKNLMATTRTVTIRLRTGKLA